MPSDEIVKPGAWFVENADPDAIGAITIILNPELEAFFRIDLPFIDSVVIGEGGAHSGRIIKADGMSGTCLSALCTNFAHRSNRPTSYEPIFLFKLLFMSGVPSFFMNLAE